MSDTRYTYAPATQIGKIPFTPPGTDRKCETAYWLWGDLSTSKLPPLIILHGGPGAPGRDWKPVAALHEKHGIPVLLYDQIGCGESTHLRDTKGDTTFWTMQLFLDELKNVLTYFHIDTFDLLGHSCGGMIAVAFTLTQPRGLRKLIIASSAASEKLREAPLIRQRATLPQDLQDTMATCERDGRMSDPAYMDAVMVLLRRNICRLDPWPPELQETFEGMMSDDTVAETLFGGKPLEPTGSWKDYDFVPRIHEITEATVPGGVLLTNGYYDMSQDDSMSPYFNKIKARVKWVRLGKSAHMAQVEEPVAYLEALSSFLLSE